jgi:threonine synthase
MKYHSTNHKSAEVSFREALFKGLAEDGGLYMPNEIPVIPKTELKDLSNKSYPEIAASVLSRYIDEGPGRVELLSICTDAYNFEIPLEHIEENSYLLRLDQGPTASFKDFGARLMARLMQWYLKRKGEEFTILTATSGDTGSAVASAFAGIDNIKVIILYPEKEVSQIQ